MFDGLRKWLGFGTRNGAGDSDKPEELRFDASTVKGFTGLYVRHLKLLAGNPLGNVLTLVAVLGTCAPDLHVLRVEPDRCRVLR